MPESLDVGISAAQSPAPGGGGFTMEHGPHSAPIGSLNPFTENVSPAERASSQDWAGDTATGSGSSGGDDASEGEGSGVMMETGRANEGSEEAELSGAEGIMRLSDTTYGSTAQPAYEV